MQKQNVSNKRDIHIYINTQSFRFREALTSTCLFHFLCPFVLNVFLFVQLESWWQDWEREREVRHISTENFRVFIYQGKSIQEQMSSITVSDICLSISAPTAVDHSTVKIWTTRSIAMSASGFMIFQNICATMRKSFHDYNRWWYTVQVDPRRTFYTFSLSIDAPFFEKSLIK